MKKSSIFTDEQLAYLFQHGEDAAETELFNRYKRYSKSLASEMLHNFKGATHSDIDDLTNAGLFAVHLAIGGFNGQCGTLKQYWKKIAKNEMMKLIKETSISYKIKLSNNIRGKYHYDGPLNSYPVTSDSRFINQQVFDILSNPKHGFSRVDLCIFSDLLDGYNYTEIATRNGVTTHVLNRRLKKIRDFLANILLNS